ncbi:MAG: polyphenol oxidase family protein [Thermodesulfobacteriota bacterium]
MDQAIAAISFTFPGVPGVRCAFGMRATPPLRDTSGDDEPADPFYGGNISYRVGDDPERVTRTRRAFQKALGFSCWHSLAQVHGADMVFDPDLDTLGQTSVTRADGQATSRPGAALVIKTADCQPILLAHASGRHVAALHAGWRGNVMGFPASGVAAFCARYGLSPADCLAVRGPSLGPGASEFINFEKEFGKKFADYFDPASRTVDLWRLTRDQLAGAGLKPENIFGLDLCTASSRHFFSYRRSRTTGRQAAFIWIAR